MNCNLAVPFWLNQPGLSIVIKILTNAKFYFEKTSTTTTSASATSRHWTPCGERQTCSFVT